MPVIYVVGLGPGGMDGLPVGAYRRLTSGLPVILRTAIHPGVEDLSKLGMTYQSFDTLYEEGDDFDAIYREMANRLIAQAKGSGEIVYAVPGHPLVAEQSVQYLLDSRENVDIRIEAGQSFFDPVCAALSIDPIQGLILLDGTRLEPSQLKPTVHTLIAQVFNRYVASEVKLTLMEVYSDETCVTVLRAAGVPGEERIERVPLYELDRLPWVDHLTSVYIPPTEDDEVRKKDPFFVVNLVARLRGEGGCPWDQKQDHRSLRPYVIEEAYEVAHAIDEDDPRSLADELGDLLFQVLLHAQISSEDGEFTFRDVFAALASKLIRRHPHVFGDKQAASEKEALDLWQRAKQDETSSSSSPSSSSSQASVDGDSLFQTIRYGRPASAVATDLQRMAAEVGFDWQQISGVFSKLEEETRELVEAVALKDSDMQLDELGDLVFTVVNLSRWLNLDVEEALSRSNLKFTERMNRMNHLRILDRRDWSEYNPEQLEELWRRAKER